MTGDDKDPQGSHTHQSDAQPPGDSQVTNPNKEIGDGDEVAADS